MADLTKFCQTGDFYANCVMGRSSEADDFDEFRETTICLVEMTILTNFCQMQAVTKNGGFDESFSNWRSSCKLHHGLSGPDDFDKC